MSFLLPQTHVLPTPRALHGHLPELQLELGGALLDVSLRGFSWGRPLGEGPVFVLSGGITADALPLGDGQKLGWWQALDACGFLQPDRDTILARKSS